MPTSSDSLEGFHRKYLRGLAHALKPVVQVGQGGVSKAVLVAVAEALKDHELIKVRLFRPEDKKTLAAKLAGGSDSALVGVVGHTVILYRPHPEKPVIKLPSRTDA